MDGRRQDWGVIHSQIEGFFADRFLAEGAGDVAKRLFIDLARCFWPPAALRGKASKIIIDLRRVFVYSNDTAIQGRAGVRT